MKKKEFLLLMCVLLPLMTTKKVDGQELEVFHINDTRFLCDVFAPLEIKAGQEFRVRVEIYPWQTLEVEGIYVWVYGSIENGEWQYSWQDVTMSKFQYYRVEESFVADVSVAQAGRIYGVVESHYAVAGQQYQLLADFEIARVYGKTYQEYESDYNSLDQNYLALQRDYDSLRISSSNTTTMMLAFLISTIVFIATTVFFALRKPRVKSA